MSRRALIYSRDLTRKIARFVPSTPTAIKGIRMKSTPRRTASDATPHAWADEPVPTSDPVMLARRFGLESATQDESLTAIVITTGRVDVPTYELQAGRQIAVLAYSFDGRYLAAGYHGGATVWYRTRGYGTMGVSGYAAAVAGGIFVRRVDRDFCALASATSRRDKEELMTFPRFHLSTLLLLSIFCGAIVGLWLTPPVWQEQFQYLFPTPRRSGSFHENYVQLLAINPEATLLYAQDSERSHLVDLVSKRILWTVNTTYSIRSGIANFSKDREQIQVVDREDLRVYSFSIQNGKLLEKVRMPETNLPREDVADSIFLRLIERKYAETTLVLVIDSGNTDEQGYVLGHLPLVDRWTARGNYLALGEFKWFFHLAPYARLRLERLFGIAVGLGGSPCIPGSHRNPHPTRSSLQNKSRRASVTRTLGGFIE